MWWRLLVVGLLLAALAGWQGWHCADGGLTAASPTGLVLTAHNNDSAHHGQPGDETLAGVCLSVLVATAAALVLLAWPRRPAAAPVEEHQHAAPSCPLLARAPALSALGLLRI